MVRQATAFKSERALYRSETTIKQMQRFFHSSHWLTFSLQRRGHYFHQTLWPDVSNFNRFSQINTCWIMLILITAGGVCFFFVSCYLHCQNKSVNTQKCIFKNADGDISDRCESVSCPPTVHSFFTILNFSSVCQLLCNKEKRISIKVTVFTQGPVMRPEPNEPWTYSSYCFLPNLK